MPQILKSKMGGKGYEVVDIPHPFRGSSPFISGFPGVVVQNVHAISGVGLVRVSINAYASTIPSVISIILNNQPLA